MNNMNKTETNKEHIIVRILRIILGLLFIFSSFVKGVDPMGTAYRVEDYLIAYGIDWLYELSFALGVFLIVVEFLLGVALVFKLRYKLAALGVLLIMVFFTTVTYFDARYNLVPDCGCFGDAIKLSNWGTFYKNIVFIIMAIIVFFTRKMTVPRLPKWFQTVLLIGLVGGFIWFIFYNYYHLPVIDFRDWKVGNDMKSSGEENAKTYVIYKHIETGEVKEYLAPDYPWNDSTWRAEWEFVDQRYDDSGVVRKHTLFLEDEAGNNYTSYIIENPDYQLVLTTYDLEKANSGGMIKASELFHSINRNDISYALLSSSGIDVIQNFEEVYQMDYEVYFADDIELKAMIRSNPGLMLLHNGVVLEKWHFNDFPDKKELEEVIASETTE